MASALRSTFATISRLCCQHAAQNYLKLQQNAMTLQSRLVVATSFHTSTHRQGLMEFFDDKKNWGEETIKTGRPWRKDELRIKSNSDLHKLWYVLLKERNMLLTMQHEYERQGELLPNPERIDKVEESMENIQNVVKERDEAFNLLETGTTGEPGGRYLKNFLGLRQWTKYREHYVPPSRNKFFNLLYPRRVSPRTEKYVALYKEKQREEARRARNRETRRIRRLVEAFPHLKGKL